MDEKDGSEPKLRILLVEDNADAAVSLAMFLRMHGHKVDIAKDGPTAIRTAEDRLPDVALLDLGLPGGMDGCQVARRLRERATVKLPFFIAVTGYGGDEVRRRGAESGFFLHLLKPIDAEALEHLLERFKDIIGK